MANDRNTKKTQQQINAAKTRAQDAIQRTQVTSTHHLAYNPDYEDQARMLSPYARICLGLEPYARV